MPDEMIYPMVSEYVSHWTIIDALRELIANAKDTGTPQFSYDPASQIATITDHGPGLTREDFLLGVSTKAANQIGQFGEGLKLALKSAATLKRPCTVHTAGFSLSPSFALRPAYGSQPVLVFAFTPNTQTQGTTITLQCTPEEWAQAVNLFWAPDKYTLVVKELYQSQPEYQTPPAIFIQDLRATEIHSAFTYRLTDKSLTNRDRTVIDSMQLTQTLLEWWMNAPTKAWIALLQAWDPEDQFLEFRLPFTEVPRNLKQALREVWPKAAVWAANTPMAQAAKAHIAGYQLLHDLPQDFAHMLYDAHVPPVAVLNIPDTAREENDHWVFPITQDYAKSLTYDDALTELVANALDAGHTSLHRTHDLITLEDDGPGILPQHFLLGQHDKPSNSIGEWGIGLKQAWVRLTALIPTFSSDSMQIETVGRTYTAAFERQEQFGVDLWTIRWKPNTRTQGTRITLPGSHTALKNVQKQFLALNPAKPLNPMIFDTPGSLYWHGLALRHQDHLVFSYNLTALHDAYPTITFSTNSMHQVWNAGHLIAAIWGLVTEPQILQLYLSRATEHPTAADFINPPYKVPTSAYALWRQAARNLWGKKICLVDNQNPGSADIAKYHGYSLVPLLPANLITFLHRTGLPLSSNIARKSPEGKKKQLDNLKKEEQELLMSYLDIFYQEQWLPREVTVKLWTPTDPQSNVQGFYDKHTDTISLRDSLLYQPTQFFATMLHELAHRASGADDLTAAFQEILTTMLGTLAVQKDQYMFNTIRSSLTPVLKNKMSTKSLRLVYPFC